MTKEKYMALADVQELWTGAMKPWISGQFAAAVGVSPDDYVDLGLPSGTLWGRRNIGAAKETDYGNYYMYGKGSRQYNSSDAPYAGTEDPLSPEADTAVQVSGSPWRMPTKAQVEELLANTTFRWDTIDGVRGARFTAANGNYIFLPAAGVYFQGSRSSAGTAGAYWSATPGDESGAWNLSFEAQGTGTFESGKEFGISVRGVIPGSVIALLDGKADKSEIPAAASIQTCEDVVSELI